MHHATNTRSASTMASAAASSSSNTSNILFRNRRLGLVAAFATATVALVRYQQAAITRNELAQKNSAGPNFYVSVDRSGGGV